MKWDEEVRGKRTRRKARQKRQHRKDTASTKLRVAGESADRRSQQWDKNGEKLGNVRRPKDEKPRPAERLGSVSFLRTLRKACGKLSQVADEKSLLRLQAKLGLVHGAS